MANGRDSKGRFIKGHTISRGNAGGTKGRRKDADRKFLKATIDRNVPRAAVDAAWGRIRAAMEFGGPGWMDSFKLWLDYRHGRPTQHVEADVTGDIDLTHISVREYLSDQGD